MLTSLARVETAIEKFLERDFAKLWQTHLDLRTIAQQLARALEDGAFSRPTRRARRAAPCSYLVNMHPSDLALITQLAPDFSERMAAQLLQVARELHLIMLDPPTVYLIADTRIPQNNPRISTNVSAENSYATRQLPTLHTNQEANNSCTLNAYLIVDGRREVNLQKPLLTLGRGLANDIILEHPGVSRNHAQLRLRQRRWMLFNLSNNSDTMVNGERIAQAALKAGDVITLATTHLIFAVDRSDPDFGADTCLPHDHTMPIRHRSDVT